MNWIDKQWEEKTVLGFVILVVGLVASILFMAFIVSVIDYHGDYPYTRTEPTVSDRVLVFAEGWQPVTHYVGDEYLCVNAAGEYRECTATYQE